MRRFRLHRAYLLLWMLLNAFVWLPVFFYLKFTPSTYESVWTIAVNSTRTSTSVSLPGIGEAYSSSDILFGSGLSDPRETYKFLVGTEDVLRSAAHLAGIHFDDFEAPRVKAFSNTTLMQFQIEGEDPEIAQRKAIAVHRALEMRLDQLRAEESEQRRRGAQEALVVMEKKLQDAQQRLYDYKASSPLSSVAQLHEMAVNLENLRRQRAEAASQLQQMNFQFQQLSNDLGISTQQASNSLTLRSDRLFQEYLSRYTQVSAELVSVASQYTDRSPVVRDKQREQEAAFSALLQRGQSLLGNSVYPPEISSDILEGSGSSDSSTELASLLQNLVILHSQRVGFQAQVQEMNQQIAQLESRLSRLSQEESMLDSLQRDVKIAEAVFSSNLTKIDLDQSSVSASYPPIALLDSPSLPYEPSSPKAKYALLGAVGGSLLVTVGIVAIWLRNERKLWEKLSSSGDLDETTLTNLQSKVEA